MEDTIIEKVSSKLEDSVKNVFSQYLPSLVSNMSQSQTQQGTSFYHNEQTMTSNGKPHSKASSRAESPSKTKSRLNDSDDSIIGAESIRRSIYDTTRSPSVSASVNGDTEYKEYESMTRELKYLYDGQHAAEEDTHNNDRYISRFHNTPLFRKAEAVPSIPIGSLHNDPSRSMGSGMYSSRARSPKTSSARSIRSDKQKVEPDVRSSQTTPASPSQETHYNGASKIQSSSAIGTADILSLEQRIVQQITKLAQEFHLEIDSVRHYTKELVDQNLRTVIPQKLSVTDVSVVKESSAALEHAKTEFDVKLSNAIRELEERVDLKLSDVDLKVSRDVTNLHKLMDERYDQQTKVIGKMTDEQRWIEEEGIKLRVEHEATVQQQIKAVRDDLSDQIKYIEERMKNGLVQFINQHEQNLLSVDRSTSDAMHRIIRTQEDLSVIGSRVDFLEDHMVGSRRRTRSPPPAATKQHATSTTSAAGSPPMKLQSSYYHPNTTAKSERSIHLPLLDSPPQLDNISISDSVKNLDLTDDDAIRLNLTFPTYATGGSGTKRRQEAELHVDESSLRDLQALLGRTQQRVARVSHSFSASGRVSPPTSHFSYD